MEGTHGFPELREPDAALTFRKVSESFGGTSGGECAVQAIMLEMLASCQASKHANAADAVFLLSGSFS